MQLVNTFTKAFLFLELNMCGWMDRGEVFDEAHIFPWSHKRTPLLGWRWIYWQVQGKGKYINEGEVTEGDSREAPLNWHTSPLRLSMLEGLVWNENFGVPLTLLPTPQFLKWSRCVKAQLRSRGGCRKDGRSGVSLYCHEGEGGVSIWSLSTDLKHSIAESQPLLS